MKTKLISTLLIALLVASYAHITTAALKDMHRVMQRTWIKSDDEVLPGALGERNVGIAIARQPGAAPGL